MEYVQGPYPRNKPQTRKYKSYADLLNRVRVGQQTENDMDMLRTRVRHANHPDLKEASLYIVCKRRDCAKINSQFLKKMKGEMITIKAIHHHATRKNYKPYIEPKEGAVASTSFIDVLQLKIGSKVMIIHNINTTYCQMVSYES